MVNSVTACSDAATALPGSTLRVSTTPSIGERIEALPRLVSSTRSAALASATAARAAASSARARSPLARALSNSVAEGTRPPDRRDTSSMRATLARASFSVAAACATLASAEASVARERAIWSRSLVVSSSTSTWPLATVSLMSTSTLATVPDSSLPMLTVSVGASVPLATTCTLSVPRCSGSVW